MPIKVTDYISPTAEIDTYPTHFDRYQKGGFRVVATVAERDAITAERKTVGMWVYVSDDDDVFKWNGVGWDHVVFGGGSVLWSAIDKTVSSIADITTKSHTALTDIGTNSHGDIDNHIANTSNPHNVNASQVGLGNVNNTSDIDKPVSTATQTALDLKSNIVDVLTKTNSTIYTPTANYHPATKKYVDDNLGGGSTSIFLMIEDRYPDGYFERNYIIDNDGNKLTEEIL
jgi:hypothetical protein